VERPDDSLSLAVGSHLTAVATATWIATLLGRRSPVLRTAVTVARECATSSLLIYAVPLFAGWLAYDAVSFRAKLSRRPRLAHTGGD
jgi:hypothetical protein